jgi:rhamnose utilization protein RhaD (predicted bifunctional aldolase and dehydrogenase)
MSDEVLHQLVTMSNNLGRPELDYVILGEGNTSARADDSSFYVKSSGTELRTITASGFVRVGFAPALSLLESQGFSDAEVKAGLQAAKVEPAPGHPSVETMLHALCLSLPGVNFIGHTHPTPVNSLTCSVSFEQAFAGRLFPDEIVVCGVAPLLVPYVDPGVPLARKVGELLDQYRDMFGEPPKVILMQNHGFIALGRTPRQVEDVTAMFVKTCRVLLGAYAAGGPRFLTDRDVARIHTRPDEIYRRQALGLEKSS